MAASSSWITTPHLRPSAAQIFVKTGEDGHPSLRSDVFLDKRYTHSAPAVVALQIEDGPPAPSDIHTNVFTASPLLNHKQVVIPQSPPLSSTFKHQVLAFDATTNFQHGPVVPIPAASSLTPSHSPAARSPDAHSISTTDKSMAGSPAVGFSQLPALHTSFAQSLDLERGQPERQVPMGPESFRTGAGSRTVETIQVFESVPFRFNALVCVFMWIILAGFLVLPISFPNTPTVLGIGFACCGFGVAGLCCIWWRYSHNYVWLVSTICIPGMFNGLAGLISTFVNLYGSPGGAHYGTTTIATIAATGGFAVVCGYLALRCIIKGRIAHRRHRIEYGSRSDGRPQSFFFAYFIQPFFQ